MSKQRPTVTCIYERAHTVRIVKRFCASSAANVVVAQLAEQSVNGKEKAVLWDFEYGRLVELDKQLALKTMAQYITNKEEQQ